MKVVTSNIELAEIDVVRDHFLCPWRRLGARRNEASSSGDPCVTEVLRRHNGREREQYGRGNDQSHTEGVEVGPTGDNKRCHDGRHGCYDPASTPERRVPPGKTRQEPIAPTNLSRKTNLVQHPVANSSMALRPEHPAGSRRLGKTQADGVPSKIKPGTGERLDQAGGDEQWTSHDAAEQQIAFHDRKSKILPTATPRWRLARTSPDRFRGKLDAMESGARRSGVALGEDQVQHMENRRQSFGAFGLGRQAKGDSAVLDLLLRPGNPPSHGGFGDQERAPPQRS
jgi:hypothetical protein